MYWRNFKAKNVKHSNLRLTGLLCLNITGIQEKIFGNSRIKTAPVFPVKNLLFLNRPIDINTLLWHLGSVSLHIRI